MISLGKEIELTEKTSYLLEVLKVEGYYNFNNNSLSLQNKNLPFLRRIEEIVTELGMNISKRLLIKIRLPDKTKKEDVKIYEKDKEINFHMEKSPFDENKVKAVTSRAYQNVYNLKVITGGIVKEIEIKILGDEILYKGDLECWAYKDIRFPNKRIFSFIRKYDKNKNDFSEYILREDTKIIMSAFSALIDAEGSINWYGLTRKIRVRMRNKSYLKEWNSLLNKLGIGCRFSKNKIDWEITISGWEDFNKLDRYGIKFYNSKKLKEWQEMMKGFKRNQISRNSYKEFYINKIKEGRKGITAEQLAKQLNKSKRVINHFLHKLEKDKLIYHKHGKRPYLYFISNSSVR